MSASMHRNQVDRLTKEIADLQKKSAAENAKAAKARRDAGNAASSITPSTSESSRRQKLRDIRRHEERATGYEKRAAEFAGRIASKRQALTSAESSLKRVETQERQKEERETKRRREQELRQIRELERLRREAAALSPTLSGARSPVSAPSAQADASGYEYDVCLSFAGENRDYVEMVARGLRSADVRVFYDDDEKAALWGKDLTEHFDWVYRKASRYCVMFISEHYARKPWTRHERRSALARAVEDEHEYILPARFDETELDGLRPTVGYLDLSEIAPATLVEYIGSKLRGTSRP